MPELQHLPANTDASAIVAAVEQDGAVILDNVISPDFIAALREETDPYMDSTSNGEDPFAGFKTTRTGGLLVRSETCRELIAHTRRFWTPAVNSSHLSAKRYSCTSPRLSAYARAKRHRPFTVISGLGASICRTSSLSSTPFGH